MTDPLAGKTCCAPISMAHGWRFRDCGAAAKVERDGKFYCKRHDPVAIAAKHAARSAKWEAEWKAKREGWARAEAMKVATNALVEAVRAATEQRGSWDAVSEAMDAMRKVEGPKS
jgi:hypothetical protein